MSETLLWVSLPFATFGLVVQDRHVVEAPPIARYAVGWDVRQAVRYFTGRGAIVTWTSTDRGPAA